METLIIGILQKSHGVKGYARVKSLSGETDHFMRLEWISLQKEDTEARLEIEDCKKQGKDILLKFKGIDSPEGLTSFVGGKIIVPREKACPLKKNEFYIADLCRCTLEYQGRRVGRIVSVVEGAGTYYLEILKNEGNTVLLPFIQEHVGEVDLNQGTIELINEWVLE
ncbi:MAG TPA: ribosome maturation factor RimM [Spirochaetales bacterium]|nr:16S rRNA processing protein RimM [Spirochaetales bacterium]HOV38127.1 ribosome maturation factor RimM [Spirochaetales bacterium]